MSNDKICNESVLTLNDKIILLCFIFIFIFIACGSDVKQTNSSNENANSNSTTTNESDDVDNNGVKFPQSIDEVAINILERDTFPATRDLSILLSYEQQDLLGIDFLPTQWLNQVAESLLISDIQADIREESEIKVWQLISVRINPCVALGKVATAIDINQLCWPKISLVWQPIIRNIILRISLGFLRNI